MATNSEKVKKTITLEVDPNNIGAFIGRNGDNFKKMISTMKKKIINKKTEITPEEWDSVTITLKFEKADTNINAIYECEKEHDDVVKDTLVSFVELHKKENIEFEKKRSEGIPIVYRIGAEHRFIGKMIGVSGSNVGKLKEDIAKLPSVEKVTRINIEEQTKRYTGKFRNIGERGASEHIMMFITLKGTPIFENVQAVVEDFIKEHTVDEKKSGDEEDFDGGW
tara:strand:+ start:825 stop:1493 length:669 start_codon:yes stop_codon:yes gene_type:complete